MGDESVEMATRLCYSARIFPQIARLPVCDPRIQPGLSVVIPCWNMARTLPAALDSARDAQEIVIVLQGCTDGSNEVAEVFKARDSRIRTVCLDNNFGPSFGRNAGILFARHDLIAFLDADDAFVPGALKELRADLQDADCIHGLAQWVDPQLKAATTQPWGKALNDEDLRHGRCGIMGCFLIRRATILQRRLWFDESFPIAEDTDWLVRLHREKLSVTFTPKLVLMHRQSGRNNLYQPDYTHYAMKAIAPLLDEKRRTKAGFISDVFNSLPGDRDAYVSDVMKRRLLPVHIVITCRDYERYLPECLDHWARQSYQVAQVVVVDDSTKNAGILKSICHPYRNVSLRRIEAGNAQTARNAGIESLQANPDDYVVIFDADDYPDFNYLEKQLAVAARTNADVIAPRVRQFGLRTYEHPLWPGNPDDLWRTPTLHTSALYRAYALNCVGGFAEHIKRFQDWKLHLQLLNAGFRIVQGPGYTNYRIHQATLDRGSDFDFQSVAAAQVSREEMKITIIMALASSRGVGNGRRRLDLLDRQLSALEGQQYDKGMIRLLWYDNANMPEMAQRIAAFAARNDGKYADVQRIVDTIPAVPDSVRFSNVWKLTQRVRDIYTRCLSEVRTPLVLFWEDDIIPPADGIRKLVDGLWAMPLADVKGTPIWPLVAGISGAYRDRINRAPLSFAFEKLHPLTNAFPDRLQFAADGVEQVLGVGHGFSLYKMGALRNIALRCPGPPSVRGVDVVMNQDLALQGQRVYIHNGVRCIHVAPTGEEITP